MRYFTLAVESNASVDDGWWDAWGEWESEQKHTPTTPTPRSRGPIARIQRRFTQKRTREGRLGNGGPQRAGGKVRWVGQISAGRMCDNSCTQKRDRLRSGFREDLAFGTIRHRPRVEILIHGFVDKVVKPVDKVQLDRNPRP